MNRIGVSRKLEKPSIGNAKVHIPWQKENHAIDPRSPSGRPQRRGKRVGQVKKLTAQSQTLMAVVERLEALVGTGSGATRTPTEAPVNSARRLQTAIAASPKPVPRSLWRY